MFKTILFDLDNTLLDFDMAEHVAIQKAFRDVGIEPTPALLRRYSEINIAQWERYERGEISRDTVLVERFDLLFQELGIDLAGIRCEERYREYLAIGHYFVDGAVEILDYLSPKYDLYLASNGVAATQNSRLKSAGIVPYFKDIFISENTGHHKPEPAYFDYCFRHIQGFDPAGAIMIGDSLTSDILGGKQAGIHTCWFNPKHLPRSADLQPDFEIHALHDLRTFL